MRPRNGCGKRRSALSPQALTHQLPLRNKGSLCVTRKYRLSGGIGAVYNCQISKLTY